MTSSGNRPFRLGTRGSALARTQSEGVARALERETGRTVELVPVRTTGDRVQDRPLRTIGGKGLFTRELDRALLEARVDLAVHSLKDLPTEPTRGLVVAAVPPREDPRDVLVGPRGRRTTLQGLARGSRVGTSSLRRRALALAFRSDLEIREIRGNLDTRIEKVERGDYDAAIVAAAGLLRLGIEGRVGEWLERTAWLPAPGQGALAVVTRTDDAETRDAVATLEDPAARRAVRAERALLAELEGGCRVPIGALGLPYDGGLRLWGIVASPDGRRLVRADRTGRMEEPESLGREVARLLRERGGGSILADLPRESDLPTPSAP